MAKPEWGTKRTCPKCGTRFYDLQKDEPVTCIDCGNSWNPEPILKAKQPVAIEEVKVAKPKVEGDEMEGLADEDDIALDDDDDMLADVSLDDDDDEEVSGMVDTSLSDDES